MWPTLRNSSRLSGLIVITTDPYWEELAGYGFVSRKKKSLLVWSGALLLLCTSFRRQVQGTTLFSFLFLVRRQRTLMGFSLPWTGPALAPFIKLVFLLLVFPIPPTTAIHCLASTSPSRLPGRPSFPPSPCHSLPGCPQPDTPLVGKRNRKGKVCVFMSECR